MRCWLLRMSRWFLATNKVASLYARQGRRILTETEDRSRRKSRSDTPHQTMLAVGFFWRGFIFRMENHMRSLVWRKVGRCGMTGALFSWFCTSSCFKVVKLGRASCWSLVGTTTYRSVGSRIQFYTPAHNWDHKRHGGAIDRAVMTTHNWEISFVLCRWSFSIPGLYPGRNMRKRP